MPPGKHAVLSASSSHRWLNCNPSARLEQEFEDRETEAAAEGTAAHALAEHKLRKALKMRSRKPVSKYDSDEMDAYTDGYVEFVLEALEEAKQLCSDPKVLIEQKQKLSKIPVSDSEWRNYTLDQQINDRGIMLDRILVTRAIRCDEQFKRTHMEQARFVTGLDNPNSPVQLKSWLAEQGVEAESLSKAAVAEMLEKADGEVELALSLRQELARSSVKKYTAMQTVVCSDSRARGLIQFYGANRTGRYAGRLIQVQNLPQNHLPDLNQARNLIRDGNFEAAEMLYDSKAIRQNASGVCSRFDRPSNASWV